MRKAAGSIEREARFLDHVVQPFVRDTMLWPILAVFVGHLVAGLSFALVLALRDRRPVAWIALLFAVFVTASGVRTELRVRHRPAALTAILAATWLLSVLAGVAGHRMGVF
jgi:uncharacterized membrane protein